MASTVKVSEACIKQVLSLSTLIWNSAFHCRST